MPEVSKRSSRGWHSKASFVCPSLTPLLPARSPHMQTQQFISQTYATRLCYAMLCYAIYGYASIDNFYCLVVKLLLDSLKARRSRWIFEFWHLDYTVTLVPWMEECRPVAAPSRRLVRERALSAPIISTQTAQRISISPLQTQRIFLLSFFFSLLSRTMFPLLLSLSTSFCIGMWLSKLERFNDNDNNLRETMYICFSRECWRILDSHRSTPSLASSPVWPQATLFFLPYRYRFKTAYNSISIG